MAEAASLAEPGVRRSDAGRRDSPALPLDEGPGEPLVRGEADRRELLEPGRALVLSDLAPPRLDAGEALIRFAYRLGVPGSTLTAPFAKAARPRLLGTVESPLEGDRAAGVALRAGHFLVHGVKAPIAQMEFESSTRLTPPFERVVHGFGWLRDLAASAPREQCAATAERVLRAWLDANPAPGKGPAWEVEHVGHRLRNWLVFAPLILSGEGTQLRGRVLSAISEAARWLDRKVARAPDGPGAVAGWTALVAAGLLLPDGKPRRLYAEAGLARALGELVAEDGGVLSRSPLAQIDAIAALIDLRACYRAVKREPPPFVGTMLELLVPPLLSLLHGDGGLGNWQGAGAVRAERVAALIEASGVRTRPLKDARQWGYQRVAARKSVLVFDAAPPPLPRHARAGCASTLAFEFSAGEQRIVVNCGGAAFAGGQVPVRIEQGLRGTAAHSTLVLDDANSTAVLLHGKLGTGVNEVEIDRRVLELNGGSATRIEASHDGYAARHGLIHRRILILRDNGHELRGEDVLLPAGKTGKRGKIGYAIRFHLGRGVEVGLSDDKLGAGLALPDGSFWQFRLARGDNGGELSIEESLWVDGQGRAHPVEQLVIQGMTSRSGGNFSWLFKKMG
ncbi:heparinase II/III-family protein [Pelagerythrobacter marensis]|uniref:Heparinase II/III-family protein n=1 Tax=Pelagerythrobacter marensis TaxID=543877 RepID=A0ABZ2DAY6_9SPHN